MPDLTGIAYLAMLGLAALVALVFVVPIVGLAGLSWLLEPRVGEIAWTVGFWLSFVWGGVVALFFGSAILWPLWGRR